MYDSHILNTVSNSLSPSYNAAAAAVPSILESVPSFRHKHNIPHVSSTTTPTTTTMSSVQRGDQQPVEEDDLFSGEIRSVDDQHSREGHHGGDFFQRPGMINNHINYNKYNSIFMNSNERRQQRHDEWTQQRMTTTAGYSEERSEFAGYRQRGGSFVVR